TILCIIKYAQSFELIECTNPYFIGEEWDPEENDQAEDRHNRLSATETTHVWYTCIRNSVHEHVIDTTVNKRVNARLLFSKPKQLRELIAQSRKQVRIEISTLVEAEIRDPAAQTLDMSKQAPESLSGP